MDIIENWTKVAISEHLISLTGTLVISTILTFAIFSARNPPGIYSVKEGGKKAQYDAVLVGAPEEKSSWPWLAEMRAKLRYMVEGHYLMFAAFKKNTGRILRAPLADYRFYILPPHYMEELKSLPTSVMSSSVSVEEYLLGKYTTMQAHKIMGDITWNVIRNHLTQKLGTLVQPLDETCKMAYEVELPDCEDWTPVLVHDVFLEIVGHMTSRILVGKELAKSSLLRHTYSDFATCVFVASSLLKILPSIVRPLVAPFLPQLWRIKLHHRNLRKILLPGIRKRLQEPTSDPGERNMLDWLIEASGPNPDELSIVERQMGISFAAVHTTTNHMSNVLFDLAARWDEYAPELIAEYREALVEDGGVLSKTTIAKLSKLDSFMKESMRLNPPSSLAFNRKVLCNHTLNDGKVLPASCWIAVAAGPLMLSDSQFPNPLVFDGFRYHRMRQQELPDSQLAVAKTSHFTSTGVYSLVFGHGRYSCPGRFFAGLESKIMLVNILEKYELRLPEGTERPKNLVYADALVPDPTKAVEFRKLTK
ncbi:cytochrome P450 [Aaosphaeria arxii CBS 175.79]|uniref:Cytochrome P450 n=1 Tax=Aaosphaeria arxii CBS 175.79 TaxID=1450172 RepID=A0A6A5X7J3_9PLEO|nr:cytochrome P450 [Aaosphaeria arxii CBS 175.79]KAF2008890.1 cytochrome P450 [Aaosphaeria arxii CBS 175.79]